MKISEFKKILKAIEECDAFIKQSPLYNQIATKDLKQHVESSLVARRLDLLETLKAAGVDVEL